MLQFIVDTLLRTADLALIAVGLSLLYSLVKFPNIAHVQYAMLGAFGSLWLQRAGLPFPLAVVGSCALVGLLAVAFNAVVFTRLLRSSSAIAMIGSVAISMILVAVVLGVAGSRPQQYAFALRPPLMLDDVPVSLAQIASLACGAVAIVLLAALLHFTNVGRSMRALAANRALADATGIDAKRITNLITFVSGALAALGGTMLGMTEDVHMNLGNNLLLPVFAAAVLGGLGNPLGAAAGALLIAMAETLVTNLNFGWMFGQPLAYIPVSYVGAGSFVALLVALMVRPQGIFARTVRRV